MGEPTECLRQFVVLVCFLLSPVIGLWEHQWGERILTKACRGCAQVITPFDVYLNSKLVIQDYEVWRLITNFFYFGKLGSYLHPSILPLLFSRNDFVGYEFCTVVETAALLDVSLHVHEQVQAGGGTVEIGVPATYEDDMAWCCRFGLSVSYVLFGEVLQASGGDIVSRPHSGFPVHAVVWWNYPDDHCSGWRAAEVCCSVCGHSVSEQLAHLHDGASWAWRILSVYSVCGGQS